jgi:hypothetical protein
MADGVRIRDIENEEARRRAARRMIGEYRRRTGGRSGGRAAHTADLGKLARQRRHTILLGC